MYVLQFVVTYWTAVIEILDISAEEKGRFLFKATNTALKSISKIVSYYIPLLGFKHSLI